MWNDISASGCPSTVRRNAVVRLLWQCKRTRRRKRSSRFSPRRHGAELRGRRTEVCHAAGPSRALCSRCSSRVPGDTETACAGDCAMRDNLRASPCAPCLRVKTVSPSPPRLETTGARRAGSGACRGRSESSEVGRRVERRAWIHEIDDVEDVGGLEAELKHGPATQREIAEDAEIDVRIARPSTMFRPAVPSSPIAGCAKAAVLNHCSISSSRGRPLSSFGSPTISARSS